MRAVLLNTNRSHSGRLRGWLEGQPWELAILLEVASEGWLLMEGGPWERWGSFMRVGRSNYGVVILWRGNGSVYELAVPSFAVEGGMDNRYDERFYAVRVQDGGQSCTVVGLHAPNAVRRGQTDKEHVYSIFAPWVAERAAEGPLVVGIDTNNGSWCFSETEISERMKVQKEFLRHPERRGLRDVLLERGRPATKPETHGPSGWGGYYDRIFVSDAVVVNDAGINQETFRPTSGRRLSDHAAVWAELGFPMPGLPGSGVDG